MKYKKPSNRKEYKFGDVIEDLGRGWVDITTAPIEGLVGKDLFDTGEYNNETIGKIAGFGADINAAAAPIVLNAVAPGAGTAAQMIGGQAGQFIDAPSTNVGQGGAGQLVNSAAPFMMAYGGEIKKDNSQALQDYESFKAHVEKARQAVGTNDADALAALSLDPSKPYDSNSLAADFKKLQQLRQAAGLGITEEAAIMFPHIGQQMRGSLNSMFGTHFAYGGDLTKIQNGGTHEQNPNGGVPMGPNATVEEGETIAGNYVFSDRLKVNKTLAKEFNLPKKAIGKSFAEVSKMFEDTDRSNDAIAKRGYKREINNLKQAQEAYKAVSQPAQPQAGMQIMANGGPNKKGGIINSWNSFYNIADPEHLAWKKQQELQSYRDAADSYVFPPEFNPAAGKQDRIISGNVNDEPFMSDNGNRFDFGFNLPGNIQPVQYQPSTPAVQQTAPAVQQTAQQTTSPTVKNTTPTSPTTSTTPSTPANTTGLLEERILSRQGNGQPALPPEYGTLAQQILANNNFRGPRMANGQYSTNGIDPTIESATGVSPNTTDNKDGDNNYMKYATMARFAPVAADIANLAMLKKPDAKDTSMFNTDMTFDPNLIDLEQISRDVEASGNATRNLIRNTRGNQGSMMANLVGSQLQTDRAIGSTAVNVNAANNQELARVQGLELNQAMQNAGKQMTVQDWNDRDLQNYEGLLMDSVGSVGQNIGAIGSEFMNMEMVKNLPSGYWTNMTGQVKYDPMTGKKLVNNGG